MDPITISALLALLGTLGGAALSSSGKDPFGKQGGNEQIPRFTPEQQGAQNRLLQQGLGGLGSLNSQFNFAPIEQQARSGFNQQTVPSLAERFTSLGGPHVTGGALSSPAFASQLGQAGSGLEQSLAALKSQIGLQQQGRNDSNIFNLLSSGLGQQFDTRYNYRQPGLFESAQPGIMSLLSSYFGQNQNQSSNVRPEFTRSQGSQGLQDLLALRTAELGR